MWGNGEQSEFTESACVLACGLSLYPFCHVEQTSHVERSAVPVLKTLFRTCHVDGSATLRSSIPASVLSC
jgi:hypothetical protein